MALLCGCGKGGPNSQSKPKVASEFQNAAIATGPASLEFYTADPDRHLSFSLRWVSSLARATDETHYTIDAKTVTGMLYQAGKPAARFSADTGTADKGQGVLTLNGHVHVTSLDTKSKLAGSTMTCDKVTYATSDEIIKAVGDVTANGTNLELGAFNEVWCSNDLSEFASPGEYVPVRHNQQSAQKL